MQKEFQEAADQGFSYRGQTVFETAFGSKETVVIMERSPHAAQEGQGKYEYKLLATKKTLDHAEGVDSGRREWSRAGGNDGGQHPLWIQRDGLHPEAASQVGVCDLTPRVRSSLGLR